MRSSPRLSRSPSPRRSNSASSEARIAFATWDGGGNVAVALGIAVALAGRGHAVSVIGPASLRAAVEGHGLGFVKLGVEPPRDPAERPAYLRAVAGATGMLAPLRRAVARLAVDALVIDCNLAWAQQSRLARRTAVLVHTALGLYLPVWQPVLDAAGLPPAADTWGSADLLLVASLARFERKPPLAAVYVGPVGSPRQAGALDLPSDRPVVVVSYSTESLQNGPERVQAALDALATLPVTVLASTSGLFGAGRLSVPANATVLDYLPHDAAMSRAAVVVCHAGHGTTMAALTHGVPLVCIPGLGRDQRPIAARVVELRLGVALPEDADGRRIGEAVSRVIGDGSYRDRARAFAGATGDADGAARAATEIEALARG